MKRAWLAALALIAATPAWAGDVAGSVKGGVGMTWREPSDDPPFDILQLEYDTGTALFAEVASHYEAGLLLRVGYAYTFFDALTGGGLTISEDIQHHDARVGAFYAPWPRGALDWRIGGGYAFMQESSENGGNNSSQSQDGGFVEGGLTWRLGKRVALDGALGGFKVDGDGDYDAEGTEVRAGVTVEAAGIGFTLGARYAAIQRERPADEELFELRFGVGGAWGWPEN